MDNIFLLLLLAHLLGDFMLQPLSWIEKRHALKWKSPTLYVHGFIHAALSFLALYVTGLASFWYFAVIIGLVHILIDPIKAFAKNIRLTFILDQVVHLLVIGITILSINRFTFPELSVYMINWKIVIAFIFVTKPASILINQFLPEDWIPGNTSHTLDKNKYDNGLEEAGKYIGILERLLILGFVLTDNWSGVGFLLAAKSVFRFNDLQKSEQRKQTEYIMIGTLLSFSLALLAGWWASY